MKKAYIISIIIAYILILVGAYNLCKAQTAPTWYCQFENPSPLVPTIGTGNVNPFTSAYSLGTANPIVGQYFTMPPPTTHIEVVWPIPTSAFTYMVWIRPAHDFARARNGTLFNFGNLSASIQYPYLKFSTSTGANDDLLIELNGINKASWHTLFDGQWHHLTFVYNANTGRKEVWMDGQLPAGFSKVTGTGSILNGGSINYIASYNDYTYFNGDYDEMAYWANVALTPQQIYNNYTVSLAGGHYTTALAGAVPAPQPVTGSFDINEFMVGTAIPTPVGSKTTGVIIPALTQVKTFQLPRYFPIATAADSLLPLGSAVNPKMLGGLLQSNVASNMAIKQNAANIYSELASNFNSVFALGNIEQGIFAGDTTSFQGWMVWVAKQNTSFKVEATTFWAQSPAGNAIQGKATYPPQYIMRNASNQRLDPNGNVTTSFYVRPSRIGNQAATFPWASVNPDGDSMKVGLQKIYTALGRPFFSVWENGENFHRIQDAALNNDPVVRADWLASGQTGIAYVSQWYDSLNIRYRDRFMEVSAAGTVGTRYAVYGVQGNPQYFFEWQEARTINSLYRGFRPSTSDYYPRIPKQWHSLGCCCFLSCADHGFRWFMDNQPAEFLAGDRIETDFVAAGWDKAEENNIRPAQWLGVLKTLWAMGSESFYPSVFALSSTVDQNPDPNNYVWQLVIPAYAQAIGTRAERFMHRGYLMQGDMPQVVTNMTGVQGYTFSTGNFADYVVVRKDSLALKYLISGNINPGNNWVGGSPLTDTVSITLASQKIKFNVRKQGSVYIYDNSVSPATWRQLDGWHETTHPYRWDSTAFYMEAENHDTYLKTIPIKTYVPSGTAAGDYRTFTTAVSYADTATVFDSLKWYFQPRNVSKTYYLWVRMRTRTIGQSAGLGINLDAASAKTISGVTDTNWFWYRRDGQVIISFPSVSAARHTLSMYVANKYTEIDQVLLTTNASLIMPNNEGTCGVVSATITPSSAQQICTGGSVTLTANTNSAYLWSTGATTQSIAATSAATYTVIIYDSFGCSGTSSGVTVTVNALPATPTITPTGSTTFCTGGSVLLTSSSGTTWIWSTGATTQAISPTTAGSYRVTITNAAGCTASSAVTTVTVNPKPILGSISPVTNTCPATDFDLSTIVLVNTGAAGTSSYYATQANAIAGTSPISSTVTSTGTYWIRVTTASSCFDYKSVGVVISNCACASPPTANAGPDQTICSGSTSTMAGSIGGSATIGTWSSSGTGSFGSTTVLNTAYTPSAADRTAGGVTITLTTNNPSGAPCAVATNQMILTINPIPTATATAIGSTTFCTGGSVNIIASAGGSYAWSTGATTQTITVTTAGSYSVTVTTNGCSATSNTVAVTVNTLPSTPVITASGATSFCNGDSISLTSTSAPSYMWSTGETTGIIWVEDAATYTVTITNASGCTASSAGTAIAILPTPSVPTIATSKSPVLCTGDSVYLTSSRTSGNLWSTGATSQTILVKDAGTYTVTVTNASGCSKVSASETVSYINCSTSCVVPTRLTVGKIGARMVTLGWDSTNVATDYIIHLTNLRTNILTKTTVQGDNHKWAMRNLMPSTGYMWQVQAVCGTNVFTAFSVKKYFTTKAP